MIGTFINTAAVIAGGTLGMLLRTSISERYKLLFFQAIGLFSIALGVSMAYHLEHALCIIGALVLGTWLGAWLNLESGVERLGTWLKSKIHLGNERFSEGLVTAFLLFCVGSMTILGAIQDGLGISSDLLYTKALLDGFSAIILASIFGVSVLFSAIPLLLFQGGITLLAMFIGNFFSPEIVAGLSSMGGILLIGMGINILEIKKLAITNMLPSLIFVCIFIWLSNLL